MFPSFRFLNSTLQTRIHLIRPFLPSSRINALDLDVVIVSFALHSDLGFAHIYGVDLIPQFLRSSSSFTYIQSDALQYLSSASSISFDLISLFDVLEHIDPIDVRVAF